MPRGRRACPLRSAACPRAGSGASDRWLRRGRAGPSCAAPALCYGEGRGRAPPAPQPPSSPEGLQRKRCCPQSSSASHIVGINPEQHLAPPWARAAPQRQSSLRCFCSFRAPHLYEGEGTDAAPASSLGRADPSRHEGEGHDVKPRRREGAHSERAVRCRDTVPPAGACPPWGDVTAAGHAVPGGSQRRFECSLRTRGVTGVDTHSAEDASAARGKRAARPARGGCGALAEVGGGLLCGGGRLEDACERSGG